jgi:hypothetical protein
MPEFCRTRSSEIYRSHERNQISAPTGLSTTWSRIPTIDEVLVIRKESDLEGKFGEISALELTPGDGYQTWFQGEQDSVPDEISVRPANVLTRGESTPRDPGPAVLLLNGYDPSASIEKHDEFSVLHLCPLTGGRAAEKLMTRHTTYFELDDDGRVWSIHEYKRHNAIEQTGGSRKRHFESPSQRPIATIVSFNSSNVGGKQTYVRVIPFVWKS